MSRRPTCVTEQLRAIASTLSHAAQAGRPLDGPALQRLADALRELTQQVARLERFHAELTSEAAEEELRQCVAPSDTMHYAGVSHAPHD